MSLNPAAQSRVELPLKRWVAGPFALFAAILLPLTLGSGYWFMKGRTGGDSSNATAGTVYTVIPMRLDIDVTQQGELQAVDNIELISKVEGRATITDIVKEGAYVHKDDVLVQLDSSIIRQTIDDLSLEIQRQDAAVANAREMLAIQESNNAAELEGAIVSLQLADVDLQKYMEGTFPQESKSAATKLEMAKIDLANKQDDLAQAKSLFTRGFVTAADVKKAELALTQALNAVDEADTALRVLQEYTHRADLAGKQNSVAQAKSKLERVKRQNESMIIQKQADLTSAAQQLSMRQRRMEYLKAQLEACTIRAPDDGMVVYCNNPDSQSVVQEGAEVRERQPIIRLPDTREMKVVLKLNESQANRVQVGMPARVEIAGLPEPLNGSVGKVSIVPVSGNRWTNPDAKDYPAEILLDTTPGNLKPSTSAKAAIMINTIDNALAVPLEAIYSVGNKAFVFVVNGEQREPREVKVGQSNIHFVAIQSGIKEGEQVLILEAGQGKRLLDDSGIKIAPATQPAREPGRGNVGPNGMPGSGPGSGGVNMNIAGSTPGASSGGDSASASDRGANADAGDRRRRRDGSQGGPGGANGPRTGAPGSAAPAAPATPTPSH